MDFFNRYDALKDKYKNVQRFVDFRKQTINKLTSIFLWDGVDGMIPEMASCQWIEYLLLKVGCCAIGMIDGELTVCRGTLGGEPDKRFGTPTKFIWYTNGGLSGEWIINEECVVILANPSVYPDIFTVDRYCNMLAEIDLSIECMLLYSRDVPIPLVLSDPEREEVKKAIEDIRKGKMSVVKSFNLSEITTLDITKPELIQYMSNYNLLHDEIMKRLYLEFGIAIDSKDKKAQLTTEELDAYSQLAGASFYSRYKLRQKAAENANKLFGCDISVKPFEYFDDLSNGRNEDFLEDTKQPEDVPEETPDQTEEVTENGSKVEDNN